MTTSDNDTPGIPMEFLQNETDQGISEMENNDRREKKLMEALKSVQRSLKLMWLCLLSLLLIFAVGFIALHFSISAKTDVENKRGNGTPLMTNQPNYETSYDDEFKIPKDDVQMDMRKMENDFKRVLSQNSKFQDLVQQNLTAIANGLGRLENASRNTEDIIHHNVTEIVGMLHKRENQEDLLQNNLSVITDSLDRLESGVINTEELLQESLTNSSCDLQLVSNDLRDMKETLQHNMSAVASGFSILQENLTSRLSLIASKGQCPIQSRSFFDALSDFSSIIFPRSLSNYYEFKYDGTNNYSISDGGGDMYDGGNKLKVWRNSDPQVQVIYNSTYRHPQGYFSMVCKALHPFVFSVLVSNPDGRSWQYNIEETGNLGADGGGSYRWDTGSLLVGSYNIKYVLYQVYGAGDPSIIQIFFTVSSPKLGSTGSSSLHYVDSQRNTQSTDNKVYMSGTAHNVYFNYILTSTTSSSNYVSTNTIEEILREIFQRF